MARYGLDLQQKNKKNKKRNGIFIIAFLCFAILLGSVSTLLMWRSYNYDFSNMFLKSDESTTAEPSTTKKEQVSYSGEYTFLLAVTNDDKTETLFFNLINVDMAEKVIRVVPVDGSVKDSNTGYTCNKLLIKNGINDVRSFLSSYYDININKYVLLTENGYKSFFRAMGNITIKLNEDIKYDTPDMFLELFRGDNTLTPDKTYKYMKYLCESSKNIERAKLNADVVVAAFNAFYTRERFNSADNTFSVIINYCESDISIVDFTNAKDELEYLLPESSKETMKVFVSDNIKHESAEESTDEE